MYPADFNVARSDAIYGTDLQRRYTRGMSKKTMMYTGSAMLLDEWYVFGARLPTIKLITQLRGWINPNLTRPKSRSIDVSGVDVSDTAVSGVDVSDIAVSGTDISEALASCWIYWRWDIYKTESWNKIKYSQLV